MQILLETTDAVFKLKGPADVIHSSQQALSGEIIDFEGIIQSCRRTDRFLLQVDFQLAAYVGSHLFKKGLTWDSFNTTSRIPFFLQLLKKISAKLGPMMQRNP